MSSNDTQDQRKEIDLIELFGMFFSSIKKFFNQLYDTFWWLLAFGIKKYLFVLIFGLLGLAYGLYEKSSNADGYESQLKIRTNALRSYEMKPYFEEISNYLSERNDNNTALIKDLFGYDEETLSNIISLKSHYYIDVHGNGTIDAIDMKDIHSLEDTINIRDSLHLCIIATVKDPLVFPRIEKGIHQYIQSKTFLNTQNNYRLDLLNVKEQEIQHEIEYLDSLQRVVYFNTPKAASMRQTNTGFYLGNVSVQLFHNYKYDLQQKLNMIREELTLHKDIYTVLSDFKISNRKTKTTVMIILKPTIQAGFAGYILALLIYFFRKNYKKYANQVQ